MTYNRFMAVMRVLGSRIQFVLERPVLVIIGCLVFALVQLLFRGGFVNLVKLNNDRTVLIRNLQEIDGQLKDLQFRIQQSRDPVFIERQAKDKLDMAGEDELVFVFAAD